METHLRQQQGRTGVLAEDREMAPPASIHPKP